MRQVVQGLSGGPVRVVDVPRPVIGPTEVLVKTVATVMSPGTERAVTQLARSSLMAKARARPDLVRQVVRKARRDGLAQTARAVRTRLGEDMPLGYSGAGIALEVGEAVGTVTPGQLVATGGAGKANHAEFQAVPGLLCASVPDGVPAADAAFATIASVALHGLRRADVGPGSRVAVIGLGLVGQLTARLAMASGCEVVGLDLDATAVERAAQAGAFALVDTGEETTKAVLEWSRGRGADAVLLTAATPSSAVVARTPALCRDRASVVVVGDVGLDLDRRPLYEKELTLRFARSYGPGRYERSYEEWGVDYPAGLVRWTEGRNLEAVLDLLASGRFAVADLVTHRFSIEDAPAAYELVETGREPYTAIQFTYPETTEPERPVIFRSHPGRTTGHGVGFIGAGAFASTVLLPAFKDAGFSRFVSVASASGLSARRLAERGGFEKAVSGPDAVIDDPDVDVVVIVTPHDSHAALAAQALRAGKHVFCEKPLALTMDELDDVEAAWRGSGRVLFVDFNRRYSPAIKAVQEHFARRTGPLVITYRVNAGPVPPGHWYEDRRQGGRLLGEVCHFVDTCAAIVGYDAVDVHAFGSGGKERLLADDFIVSFRYPDGSLATISYASGGHSSTVKERIEILAGSMTAEIQDFVRARLNGIARDVAGKGHDAAARVFRGALSRSPSMRPPFGSTRATLSAASAPN